MEEDGAESFAGWTVAVGQRRFARCRFRDDFMFQMDEIMGRLLLKVQVKSYFLANSELLKRSRLKSASKKH